ncbi:hypothetical protein PHLCEN_2v6507 [Hermanssonia centrifuga]|uniref:Uncharacterized protein n=1 Tax=Hermanssonia centrifuga TaxID=98765 RepID=A0A2R6NZB2_9APHY|nr:hypothetical protein PHLCEN_2v6507 [Hermanssonia centrifuga]
MEEHEGQWALNHTPEWYTQRVHRIYCEEWVQHSEICTNSIRSALPPTLSLLALAAWIQRSTKQLSCYYGPQIRYATSSSNGVYGMAPVALNPLAPTRD